ncbi:MAG: hypothetical protein MJZ10_05020 [Fibrobacter sp.]|nr:hypothetical protein [Fibrobacter sp.]
MKITSPTKLSANGKQCQYRYIYDHKKENCTSENIPYMNLDDYESEGGFYKCITNLTK